MPDTAGRAHRLEVPVWPGSLTGTPLASGGVRCLDTAVAGDSKLFFWPL